MFIFDGDEDDVEDDEDYNIPTECLQPKRSYAEQKTIELTDRLIERYASSNKPGRSSATLSRNLKADKHNLESAGRIEGDWGIFQVNIRVG